MLKGRIDQEDRTAMCLYGLNDMALKFIKQKQLDGRRNS